MNQGFSVVILGRSYSHTPLTRLYMLQHIHLSTHADFLNTFSLGGVIPDI